jgi:hypothetical protein
MRIRLAAALLVSAPLAPAAARDEAPRVFEPSGDWILDYAEERCTLFREFGAGEEKVGLRIDSFGSYGGFRFLVAGSPIPRKNVPTGQVKLRFTPDAEARELSSLHGTSGSEPSASFGAAFIPVRAEGEDAQDSDAEASGFDDWLVMAEEFERQVSDFELEFDNKQRIRIKLGTMDKPLAAMRTCVDDLLTSWGLDPARQKQLTRVALPKPSTVKKVQRRYPSRMLLSGTNAYVPVRVMVDAQGNATACVVQVESVQEEFKDAVCDGLKSRYDPALDATGNPVASVYHSAVIYLIST